MRNLVSTLCIIILIPLSLVSQTTIRNGVVEDSKAGKIISTITTTLNKDYPVSFSFSVKSNKDKTPQKGSLTLNKEKYYGVFAGDEIYSNGSLVWIYQREVNEVTLNKATEVDNEILNISKFLAEAKTKFRPKLIREEAGNYIVDLIPRGKSQFSKIRIYTSKTTNHISKVEISYKNSNKLTYELSNYKVKVKANEADFTFNPNKYPKVTVVDLR